MAEAEIMASILWHYHALLHQTKDISPPTVMAAHFQEKIQISEQHIAKYHKNCPTKGKRRFILLPMLNLLLNKIKKQISRKARRPSPRNLCSSQHFRDAPKNLFWQSHLERPPWLGLPRRVRDQVPPLDQTINIHQSIPTHPTTTHPAIGLPTLNPALNPLPPPPTLRTTIPTTNVSSNLFTNQFSSQQLTHLITQVVTEVLKRTLPNSH